MSTDKIKNEKDYTVEPLTGLDVMVKDFLFDMRIIVNGLLDSEKLFEGLDKLIVEKWPVMGSRIASLPNGRYELRIPREFNEANPSALFETYEASDHISIAECFNRLPNLDDIKEESDLIAFDNVLRFKEDAFKKMQKKEPKSKLVKQNIASKYGPIRLLTKDHINSGLPLLNVATYLFPNSGETVVRILLPHCIFDATNMAALFRAWSDTLNGKIKDVPTVLTFDQVPQSLKTVHSKDLSSKGNKRPPLPSKAYYADPFPLLILFAGLFFRWIVLPLLRFRKPTYSRGIMVYIPEKVFANWRKEAGEYAKQNGYTNETFLSDNDLLTSWTVQKMAKKTNILDGYFTLEIAFNLRTQSKELAQKMGIDLQSGSLAQSLQKAKSVFLHNGVIGLSIGTYLWRDVNKWPKWAIAYKIREEIIENRKSENINKLSERLARVNNIHQTPNLPKIIPMDPKSILMFSTSWKQSGISSSIDFSSVVLNNGNTQAAGKVSEFAVTDEKKQKGQPPLFAHVSTHASYPGKGSLVSIFGDPNILRSGEFGLYINLADI